MATLILLNKPFNVLCQFTDNQGRSTLADFVKQEGVYPAGRLDYDSEGLVLLTNDGPLQHRIASPSQKMTKTYWVQVEGDISDQALEQIRRGVMLRDGKTLPADVRPIEPPNIWPRHPPVRQRQSIPTSWIALTLGEGKNRQVRRVTAAVGFPTLRLIRCRIGEWSLDDLTPGQHRIQTIHLPTDGRPGASKRLAGGSGGRQSRHNHRRSKTTI